MVINVINMKTFLFLTGFILFITKPATCQQQSNFRDFKLSVMKNIKYPQKLKENCTATCVILKINMKEDSIIYTLSDNAGKLFSDELYSKLNKFDANSLKLFLKSVPKNYSVLVPINYIYAEDYCKQAIEIQQIPSITKFDKQFFEGKNLLLSPIVMKMFKPIVN